MNSGQPIRILRIITRMNIGGPSRQVSLLSDLDGFETISLFGACGKGEREDEQMIAELKGKYIRIPQLGRSIHPWNDLLALIQIIRMIRKFKPQIIHTHTAKAGMIGRLAAWMCHAPIIVHTYHGHVLEGYFSPLVSTLFRKIEQWLAKRSKAIIVLSKSQLASITHQHQIGNLTKNHIIPLGLPIESWIESGDRPSPEWYSQRQLNVSTQYIVWAGRLTGIKNPMLMVEIARLLTLDNDLPEWKILVVGDGEMRKEVEEAVIVQKLETQIQFLSWESDMFSLCRAASISLLTSYQEGTPVSLIESMACGVPVVATAVGGVPDIVPTTAGILAESNQASQLAKQIAHLLKNPALRNELGKGGRAQARQFTSERLQQNLRELYLGLL